MVSKVKLLKGFNIISCMSKHKIIAQLNASKQFGHGGKNVLGCSKKIYPDVTEKNYHVKMVENCIKFHNTE